MSVVVFALLREGTSDEGLVPHLRDLLVDAGFSEAFGSPRSYRGSVRDKLAALAAEEPRVDLAFVHRDADNPSAATRLAEIREAAKAVEGPRVIPVVPVQALEAWLLLDEQAIRAVAGRPSGRDALNLPKASAVEAASAPKHVLGEALLAASGTSGRRREKERKAFATRRRSLLERLDLSGPISKLPSWQALVTEIEQAAQDMLMA